MSLGPAIGLWYFVVTLRIWGSLGWARPAAFNGRYERTRGAGARGCHLAIDNRSLSTGTEVALIVIDQAAPARKARVTFRVDQPHWPNQPLVALPNDRQAQVYELDCSSIDLPTRFLGLGVIGWNGPVSREAAGVVGDFDGTGSRTYAYSCTGSETVHFIIRAKNRGALLWRAAYYLGYDTAPTCQDNDFR